MGGVLLCCLRRRIRHTVGLRSGEAPQFCPYVVDRNSSTPDSAISDIEKEVEKVYEE